MDTRFAMPAKPFPAKPFPAWLLPAWLLPAVAILMVVTACTPSDEGTQPRPDVTSFEQGDFDDIPLPPRSEALSPPNEEGGNVARSYAVRNATPEDVMAFYRDELAEFELVEEPASVGSNTFRGRWQLDQDRVLTVSATLATNLESPGGFEDAEVLTQYSLSLALAAE